MAGLRVLDNELVIWQFTLAMRACWVAMKMPD